jgi:hypothetical protein
LGKANAPSEKQMGRWEMQTRRLKSRWAVGKRKRAVGKADEPSGKGNGPSEKQMGRREKEMGHRKSRRAVGKRKHAI